MPDDRKSKLTRGGITFSGYNKPKRTPSHPKKSHAVLAKEGNTVKLIRFGQQGVKGSPEGTKRNKAFKARHAKNIKRGKLSAAYWANKVKWIIGALIFMTSTAASAQVADSVTIEVLSPPTAINITAPQRAYRGDTITVAYQVVDEVGEPTDGIVTWAVRPPSRATIVEETDSTVVVVLEASGLVTLVATVERLDRLVIGGRYLTPGLTEDGTEIPAGTFSWTGPFRLRVGGQAQMCAVGFSGERAIFVSSDDCYAELETLIGAVPPLNQIYTPQSRRIPYYKLANAQPSYVLKKIHLHRGLMG